MSQARTLLLGFGDGTQLRSCLQAANALVVLVVPEAQPIPSEFLHLEGLQVVRCSDFDSFTRSTFAETCLHDLPHVVLVDSDENGLMERIFRYLTGRSSEGLRAHLNQWGLQGRDQIQCSEDGRYLTIKDLGVVVDSFHPDHPRAPLVRILRELVI